MRSVAALALITALALAAGGCASEPSGDGFDLSGEQLSRRPVDQGPSPWEVEVATARPDVPPSWCSAIPHLASTRASRR